MIFHRGDSYEGMHKDGFMHGRGVYAFADGRLYVKFFIS